MKMDLMAKGAESSRFILLKGQLKLTHPTPIINFKVSLIIA
jgi:hypothetical protein